MKKNKIIFLVILSITLFINASPWEGAAVMAPEGELPVKGLFVATNSFPINTIVEITNIESGKSTRAIVAKGLDSPGLLAVVSIETAGLIGIRTGSISRVRMVQPSDPIAYLRFIEGQAQQIPPYDSGAVITEENYKPEVITPAPSPAPAIASGPLTGPSYVLESEWRRDNIITIYDASEPVDIAEDRKETESIPEKTELEYITEDYKNLDTFAKESVYIPEEYITESYKELESFGKEPDFITEEYKSFGVYGKEDDYIAEELKELGAYDKEPEFIVEEYKDLGVFGKEEEYIAEEFKELGAYDKEPDYLAEETKELGAFGKEPDYIAEEFKELGAYDKEPDYIAEENKDLDEFAKLTIVQWEERPPQLYGIDSNDLFPVTPPPQITEKSDDSVFTVPKVTRLDNGSYYVQLATYDSPVQVQDILNNIDQVLVNSYNSHLASYHPVVLSSGDMYRVLLGPMNQGESAAVLARFRSIGYKEAFVRHAR